MKYFPKKFAKKVVEVKPEVVVYFGLLSILTQVGVAESEKRVAAIFLLPVWALEPPERSFRPYSGSEIDPIMYTKSNRKSGSPSQNIGSPPYFYFRFGR